MYLSAIAHYKNKYPKGSVLPSEDAVDAFCSGGEHRVALRRNGAGQWVDQSEALGCMDRHDLSPIPKDARVHKLYKDGKIRPSEEAASRRKVADELSAHALGGPGKVPSIQEIHQACNPDQDPNSGFKHDATWAEYRDKLAAKSEK